MKKIFLLGTVLTLAACGGGKPERVVTTVSRAAPVSFGPISKACIESDRKHRSQKLCSCIQAAADETLSRTDQRRSISFYKDPHLAQVIRQSDRPKDEEFWKAYKAYGVRAKQLCG